jgi:predicted Zn finger-like uncharacterized protein
MPILIECPNCHKQLRVQDTMVGKRVKCPSCMTVITATSPVGESARPAPPPPRVPVPAPAREDVVDYQGDDEYEDDDRGERRRRKKKKARRAAERVKVPAIFMLILGILGTVFLIISIFMVALGGGLAAAAAENVQRQQERGGFQRGGPPGFPQQPGQPVMDADMAAKIKDVLAVGVGVTIALGVFGIILHGLMILGSVFMLKCRGYGLAVTATIMAMLGGFFGCFGGGLVGGALFAPCGCVAVVFIPIYLGIGIWALVVLLSADVKAAFG